MSEDSTDTQLTDGDIPPKGSTRRTLLTASAAALGAAGVASCAGGGSTTSADAAPRAVGARSTRIDLGAAKYGAKGDGRDETAALMAWRRDILQALADGAAGVHATVPCGLFALGHGAVLDILGDNVHLEGDSRGGSTLTQINGAGHDIVATHGAKPTVGFSISEITIDGNGQNQHQAGWCLDILGRSYSIDNVDLVHGSAGGLRSRWTDDGSSSFEARVRGLRCKDYTGIAGSTTTPTYGILWAGPHDSQFSDIILSTLVAGQKNTGPSFGLVQVHPASGEYFSNMHIWGRHHYGIWADPTAYGVHLSNVVVEGAFEINAVLAGSCTWAGGEVYGTNGNGGTQTHEVGISLGIHPDAPFRPHASGITNGFGAAQLNITAVRGYQFTSPGCIIDMSNAGGGSIIGMTAAPSDNKASTLYRGNPIASDWIQILTQGGPRLIHTLS